MQALLIVTLALHVLTGVFWAGTTFTLALTVGAHADRLFRPQMGAAVVVVLTGALLWHLAHGGAFGTAEQLLAVGALCAIAAAGVQGMSTGPALRKRGAELPSLRARMVSGQRVAAGLLTVSVICMAAARYANQ
ncbi:MAG TPA: hypothetical protein VEK55_17265 [Xanthobacteraceae bacterium]|nr:hypothetical protein [Xanthobacteraceae bacterium]